MMFETIQRLYNEGRLNNEGVGNAVEKNWITPEQYEEITGNPYVA
jgi:hypothetical protein